MVATRINNSILGHVEGHLRARAPISVASLKWWMDDQLPGVDETNVDQVAQECLNALRTRFSTDWKTGTIDWAN